MLKPILDTRMHEVEFFGCVVSALTANMIAQSVNMQYEMHLSTCCKDREVVIKGKSVMRRLSDT